MRTNGHKLRKGKRLELSMNSMDVIDELDGFIAEQESLVVKNNEECRHSLILLDEEKINKSENIRSLQDHNEIIEKKIKESLENKYFLERENLLLENIEFPTKYHQQNAIYEKFTDASIDAISSDYKDYLSHLHFNPSNDSNNLNQQTLLIKHLQYSQWDDKVMQNRTMIREMMCNKATPDLP